MNSRNQNSQYGSQNNKQSSSQDRQDRWNGSSLRDQDRDSSRGSSQKFGRDFDDDDYLNQNRPYQSSVREQNRQDFRNDRDDSNDRFSNSSQFNDQDRSNQNWRYGRGQGTSYQAGGNQGSAYGQSMNTDRFNDSYSSQRDSRDNQKQEGRYGQQLGPSYGSTSSDGQDFARPGFSANVNNDRANTDRDSRLASSAPDYSRTNRDYEGYGNGLNSSNRMSQTGATEGQTGRYAGVGPKSYKR